MVVVGEETGLFVRTVMCVRSRHLRDKHVAIAQVSKTDGHLTK